MTDQRLVSDIRSAAIDGKLPCAIAHAIAAKHDLSPVDVGAAADRLDLRISQCQLGLFGYASFGAKQAAVTLTAVPDRVSRALTALNRPDGLPCEAAWTVAAEQGLPRLLVGSAADQLELRIAPCQLGCF